MSNNNDKSFRRKPSFRVKESANSDSTNTNGSSFSNGFNSVRGSIRRFRNSNPNSNLPTHQETALSANTQSPISRIANIAREQTSRLKEINITQKTADLTAVVQEVGTELGKKGLEFGSMAKDAVDRWKKKKEDNPSNDSLSHSGNSISIFGAPLKTAVISTRIEKDIKQIHKDPSRYWLPAITVRCMEFLDKYGLDEVGIYRIPGIRTTELRIRDIFNSGADLNFLQSSKEDPHAVATLLKMYFRELPEPLLTEALLPDFNECIAKHNNVAVAESQPISSDLPRDLAKIVSRLPPYNFYLLRALCEHLSRVDKKSEINKMNIGNLGLFFSPSLGIGSILFKAFVENIDIVFGDGCETEEAELENEKREREQTPLIYYKTYISDDFSKSFEDILTLNKKTTKSSSSHSCPPSSSSSIKGYNLKDNVGTSTGDQDSTLRRYALNNTSNATITPTPVVSIAAEDVGSSISSPTSTNVTSIPTHRSTRFQQADDKANNPFSDSESLSTLNNHEQRQVRSVNIIMPRKTSSLLPPFRPRSRSTGLRDVPLSKTMEFSSDSSDNEDQDGLGGAGDDPTSPTLMTFDYVDRHGAKNLGVLNLSTRAPNNWGSHGNDAGENGSRVTPLWPRRRRRRPSLEEAEEWKRALLEDVDADTPPNVPEESDDMKDVHIKSIINKINGISDSPNASHAREVKTCVPVGNLIDL